MAQKNGKLGAVAAGHEETARAAADILRAGGNAFDAAVAAVAAACVAEPVLASLGGGGFLLAYRADAPDDTIFYDFFTQTPKQRRPMAKTEFYRFWLTLERPPRNSILVVVRVRRRERCVGDTIQR